MTALRGTQRDKLTVMVVLPVRTAYRLGVCIAAVRLHCPPVSEEQRQINIPFCAFYEDPTGRYFHSRRRGTRPGKTLHKPSPSNDTLAGGWEIRGLTTQTEHTHLYNTRSGIQLPAKVLQWHTRGKTIRLLHLRQA